MKNEDGEKIINLILRDLIYLGYLVSYKTINCADFKLAQKRKREFMRNIVKFINNFPRFINGKVIDEFNNIPHECNGHEPRFPNPSILQRIGKLEQGEKLNTNFNFSRQRLRSFEASPTVTTKELFIHPFENRFLTPRELARLQSFPDHFSFSGTKTSMIKQIGNAVPPWIAQLLAEKINEGVFQ